MVKKCIHKQTKQEYAAKIINTRKLSARGMVIFDVDIVLMCRETELKYIKYVFGVHLIRP